MMKEYDITNKPVQPIYDENIHCFDCMGAGAWNWPEWWLHPIKICDRCKGTGLKEA
jgi:hypothetical protein